MKLTKRLSSHSHQSLNMSLKQGPRSYFESGGGGGGGLTSDSKWEGGGLKTLFLSDSLHFSKTEVGPVSQTFGSKFKANNS